MKKNSLLFKVNDENIKDVNLALREWLVDDTLIEKFEPYLLTQKDTLIVELFKYEGRETSIYSPDNPGEKYKESRVFPIAKILKAPFAVTDYYNKIAYVEGNLLRVKENIGIITESYEWKNWAYKMANGRNVGDIPEPPKFQGELLFWEEDRISTDIFSEVKNELIYIKKCGEFKLCGI